MYKHKDIVLWVLSAFIVLGLLATFQSSQEDKAKCEQIQSKDTCEYYVR